MPSLTEITASQCDELLAELLKQKVNPYTVTVSLDALITNSEKYVEGQKTALIKLLHLIMVEQQREFIPIMIRGTLNVLILDEGQPIKDFLENGGFKAIWKERAEKKSKESSRYYWTNGLVIIGIILTGVQLICTSLPKDRPESQIQNTSPIIPHPESVDSAKTDSSKILPFEDSYSRPTTDTAKNKH